MSMVKKYWSNISSEPMSEEAIRARYQPQKKYRFYVNTIEAGGSLPAKAAHDFDIYVLAGSLKTQIEGIDLTMSSSEMITLEKGSYTIEALGDEELKIMKVFSLA
jgi:hypothetical protein